MFSQNDEEKYILEYFKGRFDGKLLDIGAYDGKTFSNTFALIQLGWSGILIEPSPDVFEILKNHMKSYPKVILENVAIGMERGSLDFYDSNGDAISSFSKEHVAKWEAGYNCKFTKIKVDAITTQDLFEKHGTKFDFINLDVESLNIEIFRQIPDSVLKKCRLFCIEHDGNTGEIIERMMKFKFVEIMRNGENILFGK